MLPSAPFAYLVPAVVHPLACRPELPTRAPIEGVKPFSDMDVQCRGHAFAEFAVGVVFAEIDIYTAGDADEDVVEKAVRFIGAAYDAVLRIARLAVLLVPWRQG